MKKTIIFIIYFTATAFYSINVKADSAKPIKILGITAGILAIPIVCIAGAAIYRKKALTVIANNRLLMEPMMNIRDQYDLELHHKKVREKDEKLREAEEKYEKQKKDYEKQKKEGEEKIRIRNQEMRAYREELDRLTGS